MADSNIENLECIWERFRKATWYLVKTSGSRVNALKNYDKSDIVQFGENGMHANKIPERYKDTIREICDLWNNDMTEEDAQKICFKIADIAFAITEDYFLELGRMG